MSSGTLTVERPRRRVRGALDAGHFETFAIEPAGDAAEGAEGGLAGRVRAHPGGNVLFDLLVEMEAQLGRELRLHPASLEQGAQAQPQDIRRAHPCPLTPCARSG